MIIAFLALQIAGLALTLWGSVILLRGLFITDEEIKDLTDLPIFPSKSSHTNDGPLATVTDPKKLEDYKDLYLHLRKEERKKGRIALWLFIAGFALQLGGLVLLKMLVWVCSLMKTS